MSYARPLVCTILVLGAVPSASRGQAARIQEAVRTLDTYPFSDPDPVPILTRDPRLYPYHAFEGYSATSEPREWTVVTLENDYIEVFVLPEVGGKVWGAVVKATGNEFIYRNEVLKFRNIALRGPWTSGGIEFNFGVIGHTPATATPVDYRTVENPDGSVSCWVGGMDLPSRTHWRVEVRLHPGRAYFETNVHWFNPTPLEQPYYNWMTAAAFARDDLELSIPGTAFLEHSGAVRRWPVDERGRYLPAYENNRFGGHKSYHVVGELSDFFGGYYLDDDYGFGHWAPYEDMPGQKLWLWALSRQGGIWEDLLTDSDGQYVEFQAGRLFVQYSPGSDLNPITQAGFEPLSASRWSETWFPLEGTGGLSDASRDGAIHVAREGNRLAATVTAFRDVVDTLRVWSGPSLVASEILELTPLEPVEATFRVGADLDVRVQLPALDLDYGSDRADRTLSRPFRADAEAFPALSDADRSTFKARELARARRYAEARPLFERALSTEPWSRGALLGMADLEYRAAHYASSLEYANRALQLDAYDAEANFVAGNAYRVLGATADARDAFGWAARSVRFRSASYAQLSEMMIRMGALEVAERYARRSIDYDRHGVPAWRALAVVGRLADRPELAEEAIAELLSLDPLHHFARAEAYLARPSTRRLDAFLGSLGGEYPEQTLLELATVYVRLGRTDDARSLLESRPAHVENGAGQGAAGGSAGLDAGFNHRKGDLVLGAWRAWLARDRTRLPEDPDPAFQFPYRPETLRVLRWASANSDVWVWDYLLALNLWSVGRLDEAAAGLAALGTEPDYGPAYAARAGLAGFGVDADPTADFERAVALSPEDRVLHVYLVRHLLDSDDAEAALLTARAARERFPSDFNLALLESDALIRSGRPAQAADLLSGIHVLPSENARDSHLLWERAHTLAAMDAMEGGDHRAARRHLLAALEWPESLGQGKPYAPEERLVRYLLGRAEAALGDEGAARANFEAVLDATGLVDHLEDEEAVVDSGRPAWRLDLLALGAMAALELNDDLAALSWTRSVTDDLDAAIRSTFPDAFDDLDGRMILRALSYP